VGRSADTAQTLLFLGTLITVGWSAARFVFEQSPLKRIRKRALAGVELVRPPSGEGAGQLDDLQLFREKRNPVGLFLVRYRVRMLVVVGMVVLMVLVETALLYLVGSDLVPTAGDLPKIATECGNAGTAVSCYVHEESWQLSADRRTTRTVYGHVGLRNRTDGVVHTTVEVDGCGAGTKVSWVFTQGSEVKNSGVGSDGSSRKVTFDAHSGEGLTLVLDRLDGGDCPVTVKLTEPRWVSRIGDKFS